MTDGVGSETYTYDILGCTTQLQKVISGTTYTSSYGYNQASELASLTYPSTRVVQQSYDAIGRLCAIAGQTPGCSSMTNPYASGFGYNTAFEPTGFQYGNGLYASFGFSPDRLQLNCLDYSPTNRNGTCTHDGTTKFGLTYSYGAAGSNDGLIASITDSVDNGRSATYTYDPLLRLSTAVTTGSTAYPNWGLSWTYDRYGSRTAQTVTAGQAPGPVTPTDPATNHINASGYTYDANGNLTVEPFVPSNNNYTYDGENRLVTYTSGSTSGTYTYDGNNLRVKKVSGSTTTVYVFSGAKVIAEYANATLSKEYVYSGSQLLATVAGSTTTYHHADHLSARISTNASGTKVGDQGHFPFGESWYLTNTTTKWQFTSYERDADSGNDYAMARYDINRVGRFSSPDLLSGSAGDPQSLNRYAYVENDPVNAVDPVGLDDCYPDETGVCNGGGEGDGGVWFEWPQEPPPPYDPSRFDICEMYPEICAVNSPGSWDGGRQGGGGDGDAANNGPVVPANPCKYQGRALSPSDYATTGKATNLINFTLDGRMGWPTGGYLDAQPLSNPPGSWTWNAAAYGNYVYGVYMQAAGVPLSLALSAANVYGNRKNFGNAPMDPNYPALPAANVANIKNGYNAQKNGTTCHN